MIINFPYDPSIGETFSFENISWKYNGYAWEKYDITPNEVYTINGITGDIGLSAGNDVSISLSGKTFTISSPTLYGVSGAIYASNLATGLLHGGILSINAGNSAAFDITSGRGQIHASGSTYTADPLPTLQYVTWPGQTGIALTYLATHDTTWIYIDNAGTVQQRTEYYTDDLLETSIIIGQLIHPTRTYINIARTNPNVAYATDKQYEQFIRAFGPIKISGHTISPNGANLKLNRTSGKAFSLGRNWINNTDDPSVVSDGAYTDCIFYRYYRAATAGTFTTVPNQTVIDPTKYDNGTGTLATVPSGKYTIQRIFFYPNNPSLLGVYYGRAIYTSIADAAANINLENFSEIENTKTNAIFVGFLIVKGNATDLTNASDALILQAGSFRSTTSGGGSVSLTLDDLTDVIITGPANYDLLTYVDGTTGWENRSISSLPLVRSFNGLCGAIEGVSSVNGITGAVTNIASTNQGNTFSVRQVMNAGITTSNLFVTSGATFLSNINLQNEEFIRNSTNGRIDFMPAPSSSSAYGMYVDATSWGFGTRLGTIRSSDNSLNVADFLFDTAIVMGNDKNFSFGSSQYSKIRHTETGNDTLQIGVLTSNANASGAVAIMNGAHFASATRSPGTTHTNANLYVYSNDNSNANDFIRFEHDQTNANIVSGDGAINILPSNSILNIMGGISAAGSATNAQIKLSSNTLISTPVGGALEYDGTVLYASTPSGRGLLSSSIISAATSDVSLSDVNTAQSVFTGAADTISLRANTTYLVKGQYIIQSGTTTHTTAVGFLYGGGVTAAMTFSVLNLPAAVGTVSRAQDMVHFDSISGGIVNATSSSARNTIIIDGMLETDATTGCTLTPQITFSTAPGGTNLTKFGSYISFTPIGTSTMTSIGPWS